MAIEQGLDANTIATVVSSLVTPSVVVWLFVTGRIVRGTELDKKDAALERKDELLQKLNDQNQALNKGLIDTAVPALARAALILEKFHTDTTVRRSE